MKLLTWKRVLISVGIIFASLTLPIIPESWAKPKAVKILHEEIHHHKKTDFSGEKKNILLKFSSEKTQLTVNKDGEMAVYTSPVIQSKIKFTDIGAHWLDNDQSSHGLIQIELRTSMDRKTWSKWKAFQIEEQERPDHIQSKETFTQLLLGQRGQYLQYRIHLSAKNGKKPQLQDFKLTLINSEDGAKVTQTSQKESKKISLASLLTHKVEAAINKPAIVSRSEWGADESLRFDANGTEIWPREYKAPTHMVVHHTDTPNDDPNPAARVRSIYYYHTVTRGWGDIGYNAIIGSDGRIYEGRHGKDGEVLSNGVVGGHAYSFNYGTFGVSMMGNYDEKPLPESMRNSLINILTYVADLNNIDPTAQKDYVRDYSYSDPNVPKTDPALPTLTGHGLLPRASTDCPGTYIKNDLPNLRTIIKSKLQPPSVIVDNNATGNSITGSWTLSTISPQRYGANYHYSSKGTGQDLYTWNFSLPVSGSYRVSVWYPAGTNNATNAPYLLYTKNGVVTKTVNQTINGGKWVQLGTYEFNSGTNKITLSDKADNLVIADAIKLEYVP